MQRLVFVESRASREEDRERSPAKKFAAGEVKAALGTKQNIGISFSEGTDASQEKPEVLLFFMLPSGIAR